jgi:hypothetical protein
MAGNGALTHPSVRPHLPRRVTMAASLAGGGALIAPSPTPAAPLPHPGVLTHPNILPHWEPPTPTNPAALSPTPARSMEHEREILWRWRDGIVGESAALPHSGKTLPLPPAAPSLTPAIVLPLPRRPWCSPR